jgi:hypothetical protein
VSEHGDKHEEIAGRIDHLPATVFAADGQRLAAPTGHAAPDLVGVSTEAMFEGPESLSNAFARFRHEG